ncbi:hypothetical protein V490_02407 [Pseudogymnoascus sp. VKM F-3557]|nr:hypothetical protein V490_02407 [Pseudogymnoascus sp. VKM F-3557]
MGYYELCGVSFNINRIRTRAEPRHAAWSDTQGPRDEWRFHTGSKYYNCPAEGKEACVAVDRKHSLPVTLGISTVNFTSPQFDTEFLPLSVPYKIDQDYEDYGREVIDKRKLGRDEYEHIAGPSCHQLDGYNGYNISVEEMLDCTTLQCLYAKSETWMPHAGDMYFEKESKYYLSGLSDHSSSGGWKQMFAPILHGKVQGSIDNDNNPWIDSVELQRESGVAFHPACFELFRIVSEVTLGKVHTDGLVQLRNVCCDGSRSFSDWCGDVYNCREQCWLHLPGSEYLVANPVFIPGFRDICDDAIKVDADFDVQKSAFPQREDRRSHAISTDPFLQLPSELVQSVVSHLNSGEIATMRLVSRAFEHLPISLWHRLLCFEIPCIYEAWREDVIPYSWASQDVNVLQTLRKEVEEWELERHRKARGLAHDPELEAQFLATEPEIPPWHTELKLKELKENSLRVKKRLQPVALPHDKTNWYQLYSDIARHWKDLKGLQNRERIWENLYDICGGIKGLEGDEDEEPEVHGDNDIHDG